MTDIIMDRVYDMLSKFELVNSNKLKNNFIPLSQSKQSMSRSINNPSTFVENHLNYEDGARSYMAENPYAKSNNKPIQIADCQVFKSSSLQSLKSYVASSCNFNHTLPNTSCLAITDLVKNHITNLFNEPTFRNMSYNIYTQNNADNSMKFMRKSTSVTNITRQPYNPAYVLENLKSENFIKKPNTILLTSPSDSAYVSLERDNVENNHENESNSLNENDDIDDIIFNDDEDIMMCCFDINNTMKQNSAPSDFYCSLFKNKDEDDNSSKDDDDDGVEFDDDDDWFRDDSRYISFSTLQRDKSNDSSPICFTIETQSCISPEWSSGMFEEIIKIPPGSFEGKTALGLGEEEVGCGGWIQEINRRWGHFYCRSVSPPKKNIHQKTSPCKMVRFMSSCHLVTCHDIDSEECRSGPWEQIGRDRIRFQSRIEDVGLVLGPILSEQHRCKIFRMIDKFQSD